MPLPHLSRRLRAIGFDDAPFERTPNSGTVPVAGVVCADTRFEGMVWGRVRRDGWDATDVLVSLLAGGKFLPQLHVVLLDGITLAGFNVVDLPSLAARLGLPCIAVMRKMPDLDGMAHVAALLPGAEERLALLRAAGPIHVRPPFAFQVAGLDPEEASAALGRLTDTGHVPEALRLAHLIGSAVVLGESGRRA